MLKADSLRRRSEEQVSMDEADSTSPSSFRVQPFDEELRCREDSPRSVRGKLDDDVIETKEEDAGKVASKGKENVDVIGEEKVVEMEIDSLDAVADQRLEGDVLAAKQKEDEEMAEAVNGSEVDELGCRVKKLVTEYKMEYKMDDCDQEAIVAQGAEEGGYINEKETNGKSDGEAESKYENAKEAEEEKDDGREDEPEVKNYR